jgi:hypothetical protein
MNLRFAHASELPGRRLLQTHWLRDALIQEARVSSFNIPWTRLTPSILQEALSWPSSFLGSPDRSPVQCEAYALCSTLNVSIVVTFSLWTYGRLLGP